MHVGIDARPLQLGSYRDRGIGRHLRGWIEAAQSIGTGSAFSLLFDPSLPKPAVRITSKEWQWKPLEVPFSSAPSSEGMPHLDLDEEFVFDSAIEAFLLDHLFQLFHETYPLMWETNASRRLHHVPWVASIYDLIPLVFRDVYLAPPGERGRQSYALRLGASAYAQRVQTLSNNSKSDLIKFAGVAPDKVDLVYGGVDEIFRPLPQSEVDKSLSDLKVPVPYLFSVSGFHHTKNLKRLLEAYSLLPDRLRKIFHLVVLCPLSSQASQIAHSWLVELGIEDCVTFLQGLTDEQLCALYNGAAAVIHSTLYEGLGLPILEAMRCGTPVVASNTSSMPEFAGEAARLVNPYDPQDIARGMAEVLQSSDLQGEMTERGLQQAAPFTWERTAKAVLKSYSKAMEASQQMGKAVFSVRSSSRRLQIAFWSPVNPRPSGVSDYSELLLAALKEYADVHVFLDGYQPTNRPLFDLLPVFDGRAFPSISNCHSYDISLYQVGNNPLHRYMHKYILSSPGIVTFHDVCIYYLIHAVHALGANPEDFWKEVAYCESSEIARKARVEYLKGTLDEYRLLLNRRLASASRGVVTHSEWAVKQLQMSDHLVPARVIPFGTTILEDDGLKFGRLVRQLLGLPKKGFVFGVFGNLHRVKRLPVVLRAFARVRERHPETYMYIMGPVDPSVMDVIQPFQQDPRLAHAQGIFFHLTYASYDLMMMAMQAVDAGINLRYPTAGETSGTLSMLLGQGKPTIVSAVGSFTEYPESCCPKTPIGDDEEDVLFQHMLSMVQDELYYRRAVQAASDFSRDKTWNDCAMAYMEFVDQVLRGSCSEGNKREQ